MFVPSMMHAGMHKYAQINCVYLLGGPEWALARVLHLGGGTTHAGSAPGMEQSASQQPGQPGQPDD